MLRHSKRLLTQSPSCSCSSSSSFSSPKTLKPFVTRTLTPFVHPFSTSFLITKTPKKHKPRKHKPSPRTTPIQPTHTHLPHFEALLARDNHFRFLTRAKQFLCNQPQRVLRLDQAGKLYRQLGFPRGRKVTKFTAKHPLLFEIYRHSDNTMWVGLSEVMEGLIEEERRVGEEMERERVKVVKKLLMMAKEKRMPLSKIYHCRVIFGVPDDFRDWVLKFPDDFRVVNGDDGSRVLELVKWDPTLAVSALEREFMVDEEKVKRAFKFPLRHGKALDLEGDDDLRRLSLLNTLPLVSPYSDGWKYDPWTLEAEKYRVGVVHELLSLTLEKRASIHHIVEFKEEFSLTKHTYQMLSKQPRTFYLAGTEMNWAVFLKDAYDENGNLKEKDPLVVFNERLYKYAQMQHPEKLAL